MKRFLPFAILVILASACAQLTWEARNQVKGIAEYKERMALPPDAVLEVTLEDVSKTDAGSEVLGRTRVERLGNPPFPFAITYDLAGIVQRNRYAVRARILAGGRLLFMSDRNYAVLTGGARSEVSVHLRRVGGSEAAPDEPLENTYWKLLRLGESQIAAPEKQRELHLMFHPASRRVSGSGGCNRITGSFERQGERLTFGPTAGTLMACPDGMETEKLFLGALEKTSRFRIARQHLELLDSSGNVLADFEAVYLR